MARSKTSGFNILWENSNPKMFTRIFKYGDHIFKIHCEHTNGSYLGFNHKCCASIMIPDGTFSHIVDNIIVGVNVKNLYVSADKNQITSENDKAIKAFEDYITKVYANTSKSLIKENQNV